MRRTLSHIPQTAGARRSSWTRGRRVVTHPAPVKHSTSATVQRCLDITRAPWVVAPGEAGYSPRLSWQSPALQEGRVRVRSTLQDRRTRNGNWTANCSAAGQLLTAGHVPRVARRPSRPSARPDRNEPTGWPAIQATAPRIARQDRSKKRYRKSMQMPVRRPWHSSPDFCCWRGSVAEQAPGPTRSVDPAESDRRG